MAVKQSTFWSLIVVMKMPKHFIGDRSVAHKKPNVITIDNPTLRVYEAKQYELQFLKVPSVSSG